MNFPYYIKLIILLFVLISISSEQLNIGEDNLINTSTSLQTPIPTVVVQPRSPPTVVSREKKIVRAKVTAYCTGKITATGGTPKVGTASVDPNKIPFGTHLYIPGYGNATALDTGSDMRRYNGIWIDIYFNTYEEAVTWGVKYLDVEIIQ